MLWTSALCASLALAVGCASASGVERERYDEDLLLRPLPDGKLSALFTFSTLLTAASPRPASSLGRDDVPQHYTLFPLSLGQLLREYAIAELHLSLNAGKWQYDAWGAPDDPSGLGVGTGAEAWAWMEAGAHGSAGVDERWQGARNALAGLFCASLASMDDRRTTSPELTFPPQGLLPLPISNHTSLDPALGRGVHLRHGVLPSEGVCTENLTPFVKLLPCAASSGLARLLAPHRLFDADWHGMGVRVLSKAEGMQLDLTFHAVMDPVRVGGDKRRDWSLEGLFGRQVDRACPVASSSRVRVVRPEEPHELHPAPPSMGELAVYDITGPLDVSLRWPNEPSFTHPTVDPRSRRPPLNFGVRRTLASHSQANGRLSVVFTNYLDLSYPVTYTETMPWLLQFYLHTMTVEVDGQTKSPDDVVDILTYVPSTDGQPTLFEAQIYLPAKSTIRLSFDVSKAFLKYTEHMPDAQRGWDLPPAVIRIPTPASSNATYGDWTYVYTPALLIDLATPDFSMPYNVIIMSCTLVAMIFGTVFNLLTRKFLVVDLDAQPAAVQ